MPETTYKLTALKQKVQDLIILLQPPERLLPVTKT